MAERVPALVVSDVETSAEFCTDVLGMVIEQREPECLVRLGSIQLQLVPESRSDLTLGQHIPAGSTGARLLVPDIELLFERCDLHGVIAPKARLRRTRWGTREFSALDPDGNTLNFWTVTVT